MAQPIEDLIADLQEITDILGRPPIPEEIDEHASFDYDEYREEFGSWAHALAEAEIDLPAGQTIPERALLDELRRLGRELEKTPSEQEMTEMGHHGKKTYYNRFGSWSEALDAAGLENRPDRKERSREELVSDLKRIADELGRTPSSRDVKDRGEFAVNTFKNEFGSWNDALEAAGLETHPSSRNQIPRDELISELQRLGEEVGHPPSTEDMRRLGNFSHTTYINRFGSWQKSLKAAGLNRE